MRHSEKYFEKRIKEINRCKARITVIENICKCHGLAVEGNPRDLAKSPIDLTQFKWDIQLATINPSEFNVLEIKTYPNTYYNLIQQ